MSSTALHKMPRLSASRKTALFTPGAEVAAITRNAPSNSLASNSLGSQSIYPNRTHSAICSVTEGATKRILAPADNRPGIFASATCPPPIMTTSRPSSFTKIENRLMLQPSTPCGTEPSARSRSTGATKCPASIPRMSSFECRARNPRKFSPLS